MVTPFKYLGIVLLAADDDWPEVVRNIVKVQKVWQRMPRILIRDGTRSQAPGFFSNVVAQ